MSDDVAARLAYARARLDEVEKLARATPHGPWTWTAGQRGYPQRITNGAAVVVVEVFEGPDSPAAIAPFIVHRDPRATLAEVEADRALLRAWESWTVTPVHELRLAFIAGIATAATGSLESWIRRYSWRDDFPEEWKT